MYYIVFSRNKNKDGGLLSNLYYEGVSKSTAIAAFKDTADSTFNITSAAGNLYFVGFKSDLSFIKEIKKLLVKDIAYSAQPSRREIINIVLSNIGQATCLNTLNTSGYKPKFAVVHECVECDSDSALVQKTVYGDYLCSDCWAKYWDTRKSLAEYVIGLANGTYKLASFSDEDKAEIVDAWNTDDKEIRNSSNRKRLENSEAYTAEELDAIEAASGLSFSEPETPEEPESGAEQETPEDVTDE